MKIFKVLMKWGSIILGALIILILTGYWYYNEPLPKGETGQKAEKMTDSILTALNYDAWKDTRWVRWKFMDAQQYIWDRKRNFVQVKWNNHTAFLHTKAMKGKTHSADTSSENERSMIRDAYQHFFNDSFWLCAPYKLRDPGTERALVTTENGKKGVLVTYHKGGITPGDSYLWFAGKDGKPKKVKMWTSILPIGGLDFKWSNYKQVSTGAFLARKHRGALLTVTLSDIRAGKNKEAIGLKKDPFENFSAMGKVQISFRK